MDFIVDTGMGIMPQMVNCRGKMVSSVASRES